MPEGQRDCTDDILEDWRRVRPDLDVGALAVTARLLRAGRVLQGRLDELASGHGLSHKGDLDVLTALRRGSAEHVSTPTDLARLVQLTTGGMTARLDRLERAGLISRRPNPADRRGILVELTDAGHLVADEAFESVLAAQRQVVARLPADAVDALGDGLRLLLLDLGDAAAR